MNCATHNDTAAVAFCRTCGKPLCANCTRDVRGVVYCEPCLAARLESTAPAAGFVPPQPAYPPVGTPAVAPRSTGSGPNPAVAGILAGFFPFGVGAVYCSQYAKGLAHLLI
ncbi:MAG: B-box zinc finger protein, partial [Candidatus Sulfotelmatobacter sp.]